MQDCDKCEHYDSQRGIEKQMDALGAEARRSPLHCYMFKKRVTHCRQYVPTRAVRDAPLVSTLDLS